MALKLVPANPEQAPELFDADGRRIIRWNPGHLPECLDQLGCALAEAEHLNIFVHAGRLIRLYEISEGSSQHIERPRGALILHSVDVSHLRELGTSAAKHQRYDARSAKAEGADAGYRPSDCPRAGAEAYLARGHWPELRTLTAFVEAPTLTPDGRLLDRPGYDPETGLFLA